MGALVQAKNGPGIAAAVVVTTTLLAVASPGFAAGVACENLTAALKLDGATVTLAESVEAGAFTPPGRGGRGGAAFAALPAFCRVAVTLKPTPRSDIRMEAWLPRAGWNGRLQVVGNGAFAGTISYPAMATAVSAGYAAASTDTGHTGPAGNTFASEDTLIDFADRSVHETTAAAKRIVNLVYGEAPKWSIFNGCSTGGRQALAAAQRYPQDFAGIIAGAPASLTSKQIFGQIWISRAMAAPGAALPREALTRLHDAVLDACDAQDGVRDGVLETPMACRFDPQVLACRQSGEPAGCLSPAQIDAVGKIYAGASNPRTKAAIFPGLERGSELGWSPTPVSYAVDFFKYRVFKDPSWEQNQLDFDRHLALASRRENQVLDAHDPDLTSFASHGGRLLMYQGWAEPGIPPRNIVSYYEEVRKKTRSADASVRLFMVPGMGHCGGGDGTSTFDMVAALENWLASGKGPNSIPASRTRNGAVDRTRPLCAYPTHAVYSGNGSIDDASNFRCGR